MKQRCSRLKGDGGPCKAWAMPNSEPPVCASHGGRGVGAPRGNQNRRTHGLYRRRHDLNDEDLSDPEMRAFSLRPEVLLVKVINSRLMGQDGEGLPATVKADLYSCVIAGSGIVRRLLLTERKIERRGLADDQSWEQHSQLWSKQIELKPGLYSRYYTPEAVAAAETFNPIDEIVRRRKYIEDALGYWQQKNPEVKEMITMARMIFGYMNQIRGLVEIQLDMVDDTAVGLPEFITRALEIVREEGIEIERRDRDREGRGEKGEGSRQ